MTVSKKQPKYFKGCCDKCSINIEGSAEEMDEIKFIGSYLTYFGIIKCPKCKMEIALPEIYSGFQKILHFFDGASSIC